MKRELFVKLIKKGLQAKIDEYMELIKDEHHSPGHTGMTLKTESVKSRITNYREALRLLNKRKIRIEILED